MKVPKFLIGLLFGTAVGLLIWYWQKSTSAEEGALAVLDRLAAAEARVRELEGKLRLSSAQPQLAEQREVFAGISDLWGLEKRSQSGDLEQDSGSAGDDLKQINGIGPIYERRLKEAGILTFSDLAQQTPDSLRDIAGLRSMQLSDPEQWIVEARDLSEGENWAT